MAITRTSGGRIPAGVSRAALAAVLLMVPAILPAAGTEPGQASSPAKRLTVDPEPPLSLAIELADLERNARGGIASLTVRLGAGVAMDDAVVTLRAPAGTVFGDGSAVMSWTVDLEAAASRSIAIDLIAGEDGRYLVTGEVSGAAHGRPVHRGATLKVLVGVKEPAPRVKDGAVEYPAAPDGGA